VLSRATDRARWRAAVLPLLLLCFSLRAMIPAGWMPMASADGMVMQPCRGWEARAPLDRKATHMSMAHTTNGGTSHDAPAKSHDTSQDRPCAFSVVAGDVPASAPVGFAAVEIHPAAIIDPAPAQLQPGIAAPPPFSTGPPLRG